ncbi:MAG: ribosome small subunit-dependent GTPase A [Bacteroidales bacterium]|nr:ribosome small subunit-dependent GTPase A [Bacteroidales bacterium]MDZ4204047.1 ribosome small subunit-dependent GTPase A [Bacteroidales bacterium]
MEGIITRSTGIWYTVRLENSSRIECRLRGKLRMKGVRTTNVVAVGDRVSITIESGSNTGLIAAVLPRHNYIIRRATRLSKASHIIAANLDEAWLIATLAMPATSTGFMDRFLITAEAYHIPASIVFNKYDIYDNSILLSLHLLSELYSGIGYQCYFVSALRGDGLDNLKKRMAGKTILLSGHSGVGKSALINAIEPGLKLKTGELSALHEKGKHTTSFAEMFELPSGGFIIDTPGIKEFSLTDFDRKEVWERFPEMRAVSMQCKFHNCTHTHEPSCEVKRCIETGTISRTRYKSYLSILNDEELDINDWD